MTRKYICPSCRSKSGVNIIYGMPDESLVELERLGEVALGGCEIYEEQPERRCTSCGAEWKIKRKLSKFEQAKQKWLKEYVKGRSWVEMMDDNDRASDERAKKLMTPEYLKMWSDASKGDKKK
jgi:hypothetical protein